MAEHVLHSHPLPSIDLDLARKLEDPEYRERFFLAEASAEIARQLVKLRKRRGYSQAELAERAGTQQPAVSRAEQADYHNWSFNALRKLTNAMGGRLRVIIEPWEDIISEYLPEEHEPISLDDQTGDASEEDAKAKSEPSSAQAARGAKRFDLSNSTRERELNLVNEQPRSMPLRRESFGGTSQWS